MNEPRKPKFTTEEISTYIAKSLNYSVQHRNAIQAWLHRHLPELWPKDKLDESDFYNKLKLSAEDSETRTILWTALSDLADKKP